MWAMGPNDAVRLLNSKGAIVLDFIEVEIAHVRSRAQRGGALFHAHPGRHQGGDGEPEQVFGEWTLLREFEKPLCKLTLSNALAGGESYKITVKPGCDASIAGFGLSTWRLDRDGLLLTRPRRHLALLRERRHDLGAHPRQHRSGGADAAVASHRLQGPVELKNYLG